MFWLCWNERKWSTKYYQWPVWTNLFLIQVPGIAFKYAEAIIKMKASQVKILIISIKKSRAVSVFSSMIQWHFELVSLVVNIWYDLYKCLVLDKFDSNQTLLFTSLWHMIIFGIPLLQSCSEYNSTTSIKLLTIDAMYFVDVILKEENYLSNKNLFVQS